MVLSSCLPPREAYPPPYAEAVRNLQGRHVAVALLRVDDLVKLEAYHLKRGFAARRDRWYRSARTTDRELWTVRGHKFACGQSVWPVSSEGAPWLLTSFLHKTWGGKGCLKAPTAMLALRNV